MRRIVSIVTVVVSGVAVTATAAASPVAAEEGRSFAMRSTASPHPRAADATRLLSATATFTTRVVGMPRPGSRPDQQVLPGARLDVTYGYHWETDVLSYHYEIRPANAGVRPDPEPADYVGLGLGVQSGTSCSLDTISYDPTSRFFPERLVYGTGDATAKPNAGRWDCAVLLVENQDGSVVHDAWVSPLTVTSAKPQLELSSPRKDRLVKGVWTRIPVEVANTSPEGVDARDVVVTGAGKGVKVRQAAFGALDAQDDSKGHVWAKLLKPKATLRLAVSEKGESLGRAKVKLTRRPAPAPPRTGTWKAPGVDFSVRAGKVRGFRIFTQTTCGGYPGIPTTTNNTYDFPTVRIPRNNEVVGSDGTQGGDAAYSVHLDLEFVSRTKARGKFSYSGPARCTAVDGFTAKLKR